MQILNQKLRDSMKTYLVQSTTSRDPPQKPDPELKSKLPMLEQEPESTTIPHSREILSSTISTPISKREPLHLQSQIQITYLLWIHIWLKINRSLLFSKWQLISEEICFKPSCKRYNPIKLNLGHFQMFRSSKLIIAFSKAYCLIRIEQERGQNQLFIQQAR